MKNTIKFSLLAAALLAFSAGAWASTTTGTLSVTATTTTSCTAVSGTLNFGTYDTTANDSTPLDATGSISLTCAVSTPSTIYLGGGNDVISNQRNLKSGSNTLTYELFSNSGDTIAWGDATLVGGTFTSAEPVSHSQNATTDSVPVYGVIDMGQTSVAGLTYTDSVAITVAF